MVRRGAALDQNVVALRVFLFLVKELLKQIIDGRGIETYDAPRA